MRAQATMGALSTSAGQALRVCIQFISVVVLSRLLAPEVFGAMAMMMPVVAFVLMFSDLGLSQATVTAREITPRQMSTLFWVNMILGGRSEEHTSELQSLMRISYAVFCLKKKKSTHHIAQNETHSHHKQQYIQ